jgi:inner membrane protein
MASLATHAFAVAAVARMVTTRPPPARVWLSVIGCSVLPDADVLGMRLGIPYGSLLGHRGLSHSLLFAGVTGVAVARWILRDRRLLTATAVAAATASHGVLDALTNGGLGVAFFSPFDLTRYFFPWRPIVVSPLGFVASRVWPVLSSELVVVWAPLIFANMLSDLIRRFARRPPST